MTTVDRYRQKELRLRLRRMLANVVGGVLAAAVFAVLTYTFLLS